MLTRQECGDDLFLSESDKPHFYSKTAIKAWYRDHNESPLTRQVARQDIFTLWPDSRRATFRPHVERNIPMGAFLSGGAITFGIAGGVIMLLRWSIDLCMCDYTINSDGGAYATNQLGLSLSFSPAEFSRLLQKNTAQQHNLLAAGIGVFVGAGVCLCAAIALAIFRKKSSWIDGQNASARTIALPPLVQNEEVV